MNDLFNGLFEAVGAVFVWLDVRQLYRDKIVRGVYWPARVFFAAWGLWNLYYYPSLQQIWSFTGGIALVAGSIAWFALFTWYRTR